MKIIFALALLASVLSGCGGNSQSLPEESNGSIETVPVSITDYEGGFKIFTQKELVRGAYEPEYGCYTGAYILSDKVSGGDIANFEQITGVEHGMYTYVYKMGQPFPSDWVLGCIAKMKTPNIIIVPENIDNPYDTKLLEKAARQCGEFSVPVFIHFYPVDNSCGYKSEEYRAFFQIARAYFSQYANKAAFVWDIGADSMDMAESFYPGDSFVDWAGINICMSIDYETQRLTEDIIPKLNYFYYTFQEKKPMFISQLAVSHFSSVNHAYYLNEADLAIGEIYMRTKEDFPRIKAVNYMSYNGIEPVNMNQGGDNYSVAADSRIANIYKAAVESEYFLSTLDFTSGGENFTQKCALPYEAIYHNDSFYADKYFMSFINGNEDTGQEVTIAGNEEYYPLTGLYVNSDFKARTVEVRRN